MYALYQHDMTHIDNYASIEEAINYAIEYWHEEETRPAYVVIKTNEHSENPEVVATIAPVGRDKAMVVRVSGVCDGITAIENVPNVGTTCLVNGREVMIKNGKVV